MTDFINMCVILNVLAFELCDHVEMGMPMCVTEKMSLYVLYTLIRESVNVWTWACLNVSSVCEWICGYVHVRNKYVNNLWNFMCEHVDVSVSRCLSKFVSMLWVNGGSSYKHVHMWMYLYCDCVSICMCEQVHVQVKTWACSFCDFILWKLISWVCTCKKHSV